MLLALLVQVLLALLALLLLVQRQRLRLQQLRLAWMPSSCPLCSASSLPSSAPSQQRQLQQRQTVCATVSASWSC
jgi:hypothetical protein